MANGLASVSQFENEVQTERVRAGQAVAKAAAKKWGGSEPGVPKKVTEVQVKMIREMKKQRESIVGISKAGAELTSWHDNDGMLCHRAQWELCRNVPG